MRGRMVRLVPVLLLGVTAVHAPLHAAKQFEPLSDATVITRVCTRCNDGLRDARPNSAAHAVVTSPYTPLAPARWVGRPHGPGPFPPTPPALS